MNRRVVAVVFGSCLLAQAYAADVRLFGFSKGELYLQDGVGAPLLVSGAPYEFRAFALLTVTNLTAATIKLPNNGATKALTNYPGYLERKEYYASKQSLDLADPNGTYTFTVQGPQSGQKVVNLTLTSDFYPVVPHISNYAAAQAIDPAADFLLRWDNPLTTDFIQVKIFDGSTLIFQSPDSPAGPGALTGQSNAVAIPKTFLSQGKTYKGQIVAWHKASGDTTTYPGAQSYAAYTRQTEFTLKSLWNVSDVRWFGVAKKTRYIQTSILAPSIATDNPYEFTAFADATAGPNLTAAAVQAPSKVIKNLTAATATGWRFSEKFPSQATLQTAYANASYQFSLQTLHNGLQQITLDLSPAVAAVPQISNWNEVNAIDPSKGFTLSWNALGGATNDFVQVRISKGGQLVFQSGDDPSAANALNGTSKSISLPAGLLQSGETCECTITFLKAVDLDTFSYPRALGFAGYGTETTATLRARGGTVRVPVLSAAKINNGLMEFEIDADPGRLYGIEGTSDFRSWQNLALTNAPSNPFLFRFQPNPQQKNLILRVYAN